MIELESSPFIEKVHCCGEIIAVLFLIFIWRVKNTINCMYLQIINTILYNG